MSNLDSIKGEFIACGAYTSVYAHKTDSDKVVFVGLLNDDLVKLALYNHIGGFFGLSRIEPTKDLESGNWCDYYAIIEKMANHKDYGVSDDLESTTETINRRFRDSESEKAAILDIATDPETPNRAAQVFEFVAVNEFAYSWDFCPRNFMRDKNGIVLCMDGFNFREPPRATKETLIAELESQPC